MNLLPVSVIVFCASGVALAAQGEIIVQLDDDGTANSGNPLPVLVSAAGVNSSPATQSGLGSWSNATAWPVGQWTSATLDPTKYVTVTITPDAGTTISYEDVVWDKGFFGPDIDDGAVRTSLDGFTSDLATGVDDGADITFDLSALSGVTSGVEFRFYFTNSGSPSWSDLSTANGSGLTFNGTVIPEPGSLALLILSGTFMLRRRRN